MKPVEGTRQTSPVTSEEGVLLIVRGFTLQSERESQQSGLGNCLSKTQVCAKSIKTIYADRRLPNTGRLRGGVNRKVKLLTEAPVNGGPNYEGRASNWALIKSGCMLEHPCILPYPTERCGDNGRGADNQQETEKRKL